MSKLVLEKNEMTEAINRIVKSKSLISLDEDDFGDYDKVIGYQNFYLDDENSEFVYSVDKDTAGITCKLIVNTACNNTLNLAFLERILSSIRMFFDSEIEIIYGYSNGFSDHHITVEVFLMKK